MYIFKMKQVLDKMSFLFIAIIILEIFLTFFLYKIIINKSKKIIKSSFVVYSLLTGLNLSIFSSVIKVLEDNETEFLEKTRFYVAAVLYTDIVKILILLIISTMILI